MRRIKATDYREYPFSPELIYETLKDVSGYKNWWPKGVKVKVLEETLNGLDSKIEVWASGGWFRCKTTAFNPPNRVNIQYYAGVVKGESYWSIELLENGMTKVGYIIDLEPHGILPRLVSNVINISTIHSLQFKRVLRNLHIHLKSIQPSS
jgi:ribosome-associated toxin RatA of RatAB toxin-antitoxin module